MPGTNVRRKVPSSGVVSGEELVELGHAVGLAGARLALAVAPDELAQVLAHQHVGLLQDRGPLRQRVVDHAAAQGAAGRARPRGQAERDGLGVLAAEQAEVLAVALLAEREAPLGLDRPRADAALGLDGDGAGGVGERLGPRRPERLGLAAELDGGRPAPPAGVDRHARPDGDEPVGRRERGALDDGPAALRPALVLERQARPREPHGVGALEAAPPERALPDGVGDGSAPAGLGELALEGEPGRARGRGRGHRRAPGLERAQGEPAARHLGLGPVAEPPQGPLGDGLAQGVDDAPERGPGAGQVPAAVELDGPDPVERAEPVRPVAADDLAAQGPAGDLEGEEAHAGLAGQGAVVGVADLGQRVGVVDGPGELAERLEAGDHDGRAADVDERPAGRPGQQAARDRVAVAGPDVLEPDAVERAPLPPVVAAARAQPGEPDAEDLGVGRPGGDEHGVPDAGDDGVAARVQDDGAGRVERDALRAVDQDVAVAGGADQGELVVAQADLGERAERVGLPEHADA